GRAARRQHRVVEQPARWPACNVDGVYARRPADRRRVRAATARHPSSSAAVTVEATITKVTATPAELALRNTIPTAIVHTHTAIPVGAIASGRRHPRLTCQPMTAPARNGHAVSATPDTVTPSAWLRRPMAQNAITQTASASSADQTCFAGVIAPGTTSRRGPVASDTFGRRPRLRVASLPAYPLSYR